MATVRANGVDLRVNRYRVGPSGDDRPVVVFVHGLGIVDHSGLSFTLGMPLATHVDAVLYALRGHGHSEITPTGYRVADHVADLVGLLDALEITRPVCIVGCSFGGVVATATALAHPDRVDSLFYVDPLLPLPGWTERTLVTLEAAAAALDKDYTVEEIMAGLGLTSRRKAAAVAARGKALLVGTSLLDDVRREGSLGADELGRIACPVAAVFGDRSEMYPTAATLTEHVPQTRLHVIAGADHLSVLGHAPEIEGLIRELLDLPAPERDRPNAGALTTGSAATGDVVVRG
jgi:pimeloyl-ACP methyl ester carboxylesterase